MGDDLDDLGHSGLLARARAARQHAYAPYSGFAVGAALLDVHGGVHIGVNVENASYGLTLCAERTALVSAVAGGARAFSAIAIAGPWKDEACVPCGACRQMLQELAPDISIVVAAGDGGVRVIPLGALLPEPFAARMLNRDRRGPGR